MFLTSTGTGIHYTGITEVESSVADPIGTIHLAESVAASQQIRDFSSA